MESNLISTNTTCNYWDEPYPASLSALIKKCDDAIETIEKILSKKECVLLDELYKVNSKNGDVEKLRSIFESNNYFPNAKLNKNAKFDNEIKGLYVFAEVSNNGETIPCYVGISGTIFRRLKQHGWHKLHNEATFAYLQASSLNSHQKQRKELEYHLIQEQQNIIRQYKVAIIPEKDDFDLYFMEIYIAGKLKTLWNSFKTH